MDKDRPQTSPPNAGGAAPKKPYEKPELVEYGDVARLTETGGPSTRDGAGPRKRKG